MEHLWSILTQKMIVDEQTKNTSLIEIIERVIVGFPDDIDETKPKSVMFNVTLVTMWMRSQPEVSEIGQAKVFIIGPDNEALETPNIEFVVNLETSLRFRGAVVFSTIPYIGDGLYQMVVQQDVDGQWHDVAHVPLEMIRDAGNKIEIN